MAALCSDGTSLRASVAHLHLAPVMVRMSTQVVPVSRAQARQRSGRAGREAPGKAFRIYTEDTFFKDLAEVNRCQKVEAVHSGCPVEPLRCGRGPPSHVMSVLMRVSKPNLCRPHRQRYCGPTLAPSSSSSKPWESTTCSTSTSLTPHPAPLSSVLWRCFMRWALWMPWGV